MMPALQLQGKPVELPSRPILMGIVNASTDSFSDAGQYPTLEDQFQHAQHLVSDGAALIDIGGETAVGYRLVVSEREEIDRVVPLVERVVEELAVPVSVDTYKPAVAEAAIEAGAVVVNDVSGLADPALAELCATTGAGLVIMHTRVPPKGILQDPDYYDDVVDDVIQFFNEKLELAQARGVSRGQIILDPGPDFAKTPAQTVEVLKALPRLRQLGYPILWAVSRKDFIGEITGERSPRERSAGTLAALAHGYSAGADIFRVHDVRSASDYLKVASELSGGSVPT